MQDSRRHLILFKVCFGFGPVHNGRGFLNLTEMNEYESFFDELETAIASSLKEDDAGNVTLNTERIAQDVMDFLKEKEMLFFLRADMEDN